MDGHYTTKEVAAMTNLKPSRIRQLLIAGTIIGIKPNGTADWWIPLSQIEVIKLRPDGRKDKPKRVNKGLKKK